MIEIFKKKTKFFLLLSLSFILISCQIESNTFVVLSDTHYNGTKNRTTVIDSMIQDINSLKNEKIPFISDNGKINELLGVIHCGDITEKGKKRQWKEFKSTFGLNGTNCDLKYDIMETFGNHDGDTSGIVRKGIVKRNKNREDVTNISNNGLHYSWDWQDHHFVILGSYPGNKWDPNCEWCHYFEGDAFQYPQYSLSFLKKDLKTIEKDKPVFLFLHYGWDDFSKKWWTKEERNKFYNVIKDYSIKAIFHGHNHVVNHSTWKNIDIFSVGSPQKDSTTGNYLVVQAEEDELIVAEREFNRWVDTLYSE